ncbi:MAG TPA: ATP-dependent DNA helicase RecG [Treponema sp.]|nr:ATP-dependent DNA helicase RecG [Treponema sp.]
MFIREINIPVSTIKGVGPATLKPLTALGISTVGDLFAHWPRDWEDRTKFHTLADFDKHGKINIAATVVSQEWFGYGKMRTLKILIRDATEMTAELVCFNRPFMEKQFPVDSLINVYGSFRYAYGSLQSSAFEIEHKNDSSARVLPVYSLSAGISQTQIRKIISIALREYGRGIDSEVPEKVRTENDIPAKQELLHSMHAPATMAEAQAALQALIFEELFIFEYAIGQRSLERRGRLPQTELPEITAIAQSDVEAQHPATAAQHPTTAAQHPATLLQLRLLDRLPFPLTPDQKIVLGEINADLASPAGMARLLQGDVGSGKTLIAFLAAVGICESGGQTAILAPTELLARQHAETAARLLEPTGMRIAFLSGNVKASGRARLLERLLNGEIDLVIGTHALFSANVRYSNLRLVVIDEQQRFGVLQRSAIIDKGRESNAEGKNPHLLMMSATPIPRTLALSVFGDLDVSVIRTMPPGRKPVITHLAVQGNEGKVHDFVRRELAAGNQAYFVYPLIDPSDTTDLTSATDMFKKLSETVFPGTACALIHSRIPEDTQRSIMEAFRDQRIQILVATSVVEVGVDVPTATCMVIEHAERFGLSALHQLRGRVGRGSKQSYCFLVYAKNLTETGKARLRVLHETNDGFIIAEEDLKLRGPGDITGIQQSGYMAFILADPIRDYDLLVQARKAAFELLESL